MAQLTHVRYTPRLTLRPFALTDLDDLTIIYQHEEICRYLYWDPRDRAASLAALEKSVQRPIDIVDDNVLNVAVTIKGTNRVIGDFMLRWMKNEHRQGEIGGSLHPEFHHQGFASEVYTELLVIGFTLYELHRIVGRCDARNAASVRSLERVGLREEAHFIENEFVKGEWTDEIVMAIRKSEWAPRPNAREA
jgi:RimJ/RimL family protein N-acetyltransferase